MRIDWQEVEEKIKNYKYSYIIVFKFFNLLEFMDDKNASQILRLILKYHNNVFYDNPLFLLCQYIPYERYQRITEIIMEYYKLLSEKVNLVLTIQKWYNVYKKPDFWKLDTEKQIEYLNNLNNQIILLFDAKSNVLNIVHRTIQIIHEKKHHKHNHHINFHMIKERFHKIFKLLGYKFYQQIKIPILTFEDFDHMDDDKKIKYVQDFFTKTLIVIQQIIKIFENYHVINSKIDNLLNFIEITIDETTVDDEEDIIQNISEYF